MSHPQEWLDAERQIVAGVEEDVEKWKPSCIAAGSIKMVTLIEDRAAVPRNVGFII